MRKASQLPRPASATRLASIVQQISPSNDYRLLQPVYALGLINEVFDTGTADWYHHYKIVNIDKPTREIKGLQFVFVEIPKFKPETALDKKIRLLWLRFLKEINQGEFEPPPELLAYPPIAEALEISREAGFTEAELWRYQSYWDAVSVEVTLLGERAALAEERGMARGMEKGMAQGMEKGALAEKQAIARKLLDVLDDATIAAKTGLAVEEAARLRQN